MWPFKRRIKIKVEERPTTDAGMMYLVRLINLPDPNDGGVIHVTGVGSSANEAARRAFAHAADLVCPIVN